MINTTYITVLQVIESFASAHLQVKKFASDFPEQMGNFATKNEAYPILFVSPTNSIFLQGTNTLELDVYCYDIIQKDRANISTVLSDTAQILNDLDKWLRYADLAGIQLSTTTSLQPLNNDLLDYAAGWRMHLILDVSTYTICEIPFAEAPVVISIVNDIVYAPFLTCETLEECPVITGIQEDIAALSGSTGAAWGSITGDINDQLDLIAAFETVYDDIDTINTEIDNLNDDVDDVNARIDNLTLEDVRTNNNVVQGDILFDNSWTIGDIRDAVDLQEPVTLNQYQAGFNPLNAQVTANTANIISISGVNTTQTAQILTLSGNVATNTANILSVSGVNTTQTAQILSLSGSVTANTASIVSNTANILSLSGTVTGHTTQIASNAAAILAVSAVTTGHTSQIASNTANILSLSGTVTGNTVQIATNTAAILAVSAVTTGNTASIAALGAKQLLYLPLSGGQMTGAINFLPQTAPATPASGVTIYARSTGAFTWKGTNGFARSFLGTGMTGDRDFTLPDTSGMLTLNPLQTTGVTIAFAVDKVYGTTAAPSTGNITADLTNAQLGTTNIIVHSGGTAPTFSSEFRKLSGSGSYSTTALNYIYCSYLDATHIMYAINQST